MGAGKAAGLEGKFGREGGGGGSRVPKAFCGGFTGACCLR